MLWLKIKNLTATISFVWSFSKDTLGSIIYTIFFYNLVLDLLLLINAFIVKFFVDALMAGMDNETAIFSSTTSFLLLFLVIAICAKFIKVHRLALLRVLGQQISNAVSLRLLDKWNALSTQTTDQQHVIDRYQMLQEKVPVNVSHAFRNVFYFLSACTVFLLVSGLVFWFDWRYGVAVLVLGLPSIYLKSRADGVPDEIDERLEKYEMQAVAQQTFLEESTAESQVFDLRNTVFAKLRRLHKQGIEFMEKSENSTIPTAWMYESLPLVGVVLVAYFSLQQVLTEELSMSMWLVVVASTWLMAVVFGKMIAYAKKVVVAAPVIDNFIVFVTKAEKRAEKIRTLKFEEIETVEFNEVGFGQSNLPGNSLKNITVSFGKGEKIALINADEKNSASTFINVLSGMYRPTKGEVLINELNIHEHNESSYWKHIGVLTKVYEKIGLSCREFVGFGKAEDMQQLKLIKRATKKVGMDAFIGKLNRGYNTPLDPSLPHGISLTKEQQVLMSMARLLYRDPLLYLVDIPTSNLTYVQEQKIYELFCKYLKDEILVYVPYHPSSAIFADKVLVFKDGVVIEEGSYKELEKKRKGEFSSILKSDI